MKKNSRKSNKTSTTKTSKTSLRYWFLLPLILVIGFLSWPQTKTTHSNKVVASSPSSPAIDPDTAYKIKIRSEGIKYQRSKTQPESWFLTTKPEMSAGTLNLLADRKVRILDVLNKYRHVSPLAGEVASAFTDFQMAVKDDERMYYYVPNSEIGSTPPSCSVCFVPADVVNRDRSQIQIFWSSGAKSLVIPAVRFSESLFAGYVFHEFGHGLRHSIQGLPNSNDPLHAEEEVEMHSLGAFVMNEASNGRFFATIGSILEREQPRNYKEAIAALTAEDMLSLDSALDAGVNRLETMYLCTEYYFVTAFLFIDNNGGTSSEKVECYRWLVNWTAH